MKIEKQLRHYIIPNVLAMMGTSCYILADTFFISVAEGSKGIATLNLTLPVYGIIFAIGAMIGTGSATRYSLEKAMDEEEKDKYFFNAVFWEITFGLLFVLIGVFGPDKMLMLMGGDAAIIKIGTPYLRIAMCFAPFFMLNNAFTSFVRNDGSPHIAMAATLSSSLFNILFDYILMFPLKLGMTGAALATAFSPIVSMTICLLHYLSQKNTIHFSITRPSVRILKKAGSLGVVGFIGEMASGVTTLAFNYILLELGGNIAVAAYGVIANTALVGTSIFNGISQGLQPLASLSHGRGEKENEKRILHHALWIGISFAVIMVGGIFIFAKPCVAVFNSEHSAQMAAYAVHGIRIYFIGFLLAAVNIIRAGFLSATGKGLECSMISILRGIVAIVIFAFLLSKAFGITGVWMAFPIAELFTLIVTAAVHRFFVH